MLHAMGGYEHWAAPRLYLARTAKGYTRNARRDDIGAEHLFPFLDEDARIYNPRWIAREYHRKVKTVKRWMQKHGGTVTQQGKQGLSEAQYDAFQHAYAPKIDKQRLRALGHSMGMTAASIARMLKADRMQGKSYQDLERAMKRNASRQQQRRARKGEAMPDLPSLADQRAELRASLLSALPEARDDILDALRRLAEG
jgi:hypothetical protein